MAHNFCLAERPGCGFLISWTFLQDIKGNRRESALAQEAWPCPGSNEDIVQIHIMLFIFNCLVTVPITVLSTVLLVLRGLPVKVFLNITNKHRIDREIYSQIDC